MRTSAGAALAAAEIFLWLLGSSARRRPAHLGVITFVRHRRVLTIAIPPREGSRVGLTRRNDLVPEAF